MSNFSQYFPASSSGGSGGIPVNGYTPFLVEFTGQPSGYNSTTGLYTHPDGTYWMESGKTLEASAADYPDATSVSTYSYPTAGVAFESFDISAVGVNEGGICTDGTNFYLMTYNRACLVYNSAGIQTGTLFTYGSVGVNGRARGITFDGTHLWVIDNNTVNKFDLAGTFITSIALTTPSIGGCVATDGTSLWACSSNGYVNTYNIATGLQTGTTFTVNAQGGTIFTGLTYEAPGFLLALDGPTSTNYRYTTLGSNTGNSIASFPAMGSSAAGGFSVSTGFWEISRATHRAYLITKTSVIGDATARTDTDTAQPLFTRIK